MNDERRPLGTAGLCFLIVAVVFLLVFLLYPVGHVLVRAFLLDAPGGGRRVSLDLVRFLFTDYHYRTALLNSFLLAVVALAGTTLISLPLALLTARYDFPGKRWVTGLVMVPMIMPPFVGAMGMRRILARGGSLNLLLMKMGFIAEADPIPFLSEGKFWAVALLEVLHLYPIMYLNVAAALANVDPSLEDAARNLGDRGFRLFRKITLPLMLPGFLAGSIIVFIWAFTDLGTPLMFNFQQVVSCEIFNMSKDIHQNPMGHMLVLFVVLFTTSAFVGSRLLLRGGGFAPSVRSPAGSTEARLSRRGAALAWAGILAITGLALLPHIGVFLTSIAGKWSGTVLPSAATGAYYTQVFHHELLVPSIRNSLILSTGSTILDIILGVGIAYLLARRRFPGAMLLDTVVMLPLALPGLVIAFGYMSCFDGTPLDPSRNPMPLLMIAYAIRRLPFMVRAAHAGLAQSSVELEEASLNLGATPARTLRKITVPLISANILAGTILCFAFAMLEVSDSLILALNDRYYPITKALYQLSNRIGDGDFVASAMGVLAMIMLFVTLISAGTLLGKKMGMLFRA